MSAIAHELQRLTQHLAVESRHAQDYVQRGMAHFKLGHIAAAIDDFDRAEHLNPALTPYLWQRGAAHGGAAHG